MVNNMETILAGDIYELKVNNGIITITDASGAVLINNIDHTKAAELLGLLIEATKENMDNSYPILKMAEKVVSGTPIGIQHRNFLKVMEQIHNNIIPNVSFSVKEDIGEGVYWFNWDEQVKPSCPNKHQ